MTIVLMFWCYDSYTKFLVIGTTPVILCFFNWGLNLIECIGSEWQLWLYDGHYIYLTHTPNYIYIFHYQQRQIIKYGRGRYARIC